MAGLATVGDYIKQARILLQDTRDPFRYADTEMVAQINIGLMEARRLRGDLFLPLFEVPVLEEGLVDTNQKVPMDIMYRSPLLYYLVGKMQLRDDEATTDSRAAALIAKFTQQMLLINT